MRNYPALRIKLFADGADKAGMLEMRHPLIEGFTTNPTLMRKAGIVVTRPSPWIYQRDRGPADILRGVLG